MKFHSFLLNINYFSVDCKSINDIAKDPALNLLRRNQEFELVLNKETNYQKYIKYIYLNRKSILDILFDEENKIDIQNIILKNKNYNKLESFIYYLCLLIEENKDIVYFIYPADFISKIKSYFDINNNINNNIYSSIIFCKILLVLIDNYLSENYLNANQELKNTKKELEEIIKNNYEKFKEINLNLTFEEIISKTLDEIYSDILVSTLKIEIRDKFNKAINILTQLNLDVIDIVNKNIFNKIKLALNDRNFKKKYLIQNWQDFNDVNKINMYFILLKYIFKDSISIYQIPFLLEARICLIRNIKTNKNRIFDNKINNKIFVIKRLLDLDYYINKYLEGQKEEEMGINLEDLNNDEIEFEIKEEIKNENEIKNIKNIKELEDINEVLTYYKNFKFESKKRDIDLIETKIKNEELADLKELYLKDLNEAKKMNLRYPIIKFLYLNGNNKNKPLSEKEINKTADSFGKYEKVLNEKKLNKIPATEHKLLFEYFKNPENSEQFINIFSKDIYDLFMKFNKLKVVYNYYNHFFFESKKEENKIIDKLIKDKSFNNRETELYLKDYEIAEKMNLRYYIILYLSQGENKENKEDKKSEKKINEISSLWNKYIEKLIKEKKENYNEIPKSLQNLLLDFFRNKEREEYLLKIFSIEEIEFFRNLDLNEIEINFNKEEDKKIEIKNKDINEKIEEKEKKKEKKDIIPISKVEIDPEETAFKTKILSSVEKNKGNLKINLNDDEIVLMFEIYGNNIIDEINKNKINDLIKKYEAMKGGIKGRKKNKLNKNLIKETCLFCSNNKNKEKMLKFFSQDDIDFLLSLNQNKNIIVKKENKIEPEIINKLKEVQQYYINYFKEKKKDDINIINQILQEQNKSDIRITQYIKIYDEAYEMNIRYPLIDYLFQIKLKENKAKEISEVFEAWKRKKKYFSIFQTRKK